MAESLREVLAREADEAEAIADAAEQDEPAAPRAPRGRRAGVDSASQVYSLRLPAEAIRQLRELAEKADEPPTALLRRFVVERLDQERSAALRDPIDEAVQSLLPLVRARLAEQASRHVRRAPERHGAGTLTPPAGLNIGGRRRVNVPMTHDLLESS